MAVGGKSQLGDKVEVLDGRRIVAFPDLDAHDAWVEKIEERPHLNIQISDLLIRNATPEDFASGLDIADFIVRAARHAGIDPASRPQRVEPQKLCHPERSEGSILDLVLSEYRDNLAGLISEFDLVLVNHTQYKNPNPNTHSSNENQHQNPDRQRSRPGNARQVLAGWPLQGISIHA